MPYHITKDPAGIGLLLANLLVIPLAYSQNWSIFEVIFIYYAQFVILLITSTIRIKNIKTKIIGLVVFIAIALFYLKALLTPLLDNSKISIIETIFQGSPISIVILALPIIVFAISHTYSVFKSEKNSNILVYRPLVMIFPIHLGMGLAIFVGYQPTFNLPVLIIFCLIKTFFDIFIHAEEYNSIERQALKAKQDKEANDKNFITEI